MAPTTSPRSPGLGRHVTEVATLTLGSLEIPCTRALFGALSAELDRTPAVAAQPLMGTGKIANTAELSGAVAVMRRGEISFVEKALKAQLRQAVALVVVNSDNHPFVPDAGTLDTSDISIPVVCVRKSDGARLLERLKRSALVSLRFAGTAEDRAQSLALPEQNMRGMAAAATMGRRWKRRAAQRRAVREAAQRTPSAAWPVSPVDRDSPASAAARAPSEHAVPLWPSDAPLPTPGEAVPAEERRADAHGFFNQMHDLTAEIPALTLHLRPQRALAPCVIVLPGGGYMTRCDGVGEERDHEGPEIAAWLNSLGFHAVVLHYRVQHRAPTSLLDAQRAVQLVRYRPPPPAICQLLLRGRF